jgi:GPH family glycoside/pentoside/hexuronide:cation symporter
MHAPLPSSSSASLTTGIKAGWATGAFGVALLMNGISALMLFYLVSVTRLDPAIAGAVIFLSKIYDAFSDPVSGYLSDRTKSKQGRRRPWLFWGAIVSSLSFVMVFTIPFQGPFDSDLSGTGLMAAGYAMLALILYTTGYSMFNVPYMAMPAEMTEGYHERSSIHGWRVIFASVGGFIAQSMMGGVLLEKMGKDWDAHATMGVIGGVLIFLTMMIAYFATKRAPTFERSERKLPIREQVAAIARNKPFQIILGVKLVQLIGVSATSVGLMFFLVNVIDMPLTKLPIIGGMMLLAVFTCTPLLIRLSKTIGKRGGYLATSVITGLVGLSWIFATPAEPDWALAVRGFFNGIAFAGNVLFAMSMLTDAMELDSHNTGVRQEGIYSALYSFIEKIAAAIAPLILGIALKLAGFDPANKPEVVDPQVRQAVLLAVSYIPIAMAFVACALLAFYRLKESDLIALRAARTAA